MSPGPPGEPNGPRRIDWNRLPGPGEARPPTDPRSEPRRGGLPTGPVAGSGPARPVRRVDGTTAPRDRVEGATGPRDRVAAERARATGPSRGGAPRDGARQDGVAENDAADDSAADGGALDDHASRGKRKGGSRDRESESRLSQPHKRQYLSLWVELPLLLVVAFSAAVLLRTFAVQPFYIPSGSMEQTLQEGDKVLVLKLTTTLRTPQRGEVVVFRGTDSWDPEYRPAAEDDSLVSDFTTGVLDLIGLAEPDEKDFIKRVIAVGGDTVACCDADGNVVVNGVSLHEEDYVYDNSPLDGPAGTCHSRVFEEITVPEGEVWVMGDHRGNSKDSRCQGPVPVENIIGRAIALVWPTDRATELEIPDAFAVLDGTGAGAAEDGSATAAPALDTSWHAPPSLPATVIPPNGTGTAARPGTSGAGARARRLAP